MARLMRMPELAAASTEALLQEWEVSVGDEFAKDGVVAIVETDKATADLSADAAGVLVSVLVEAGRTVEVGTPIAVLGDPGEQVDVEAFLAAEGVSVESTPSASSTVASSDPGTGAGAGDVEPAAPAASDPSLSTAAARQENAAGEAARHGHAPASAPASVSDRSTGAEAVEGAGDRLFISPLARRIAEEHDLDPSEIPGTGPRGRIRRRDVEAALQNRGMPVAPQDSAGHSSTRTTTPNPNPTPAPTGGGGYTEIPHSRFRKAVARSLQASKQQAPHFYLSASVKVDELLALRTQINGASARKISVNDLVVKAVGVAMTRVPEFNVTWHEEAVHAYEHADVAVAVAAEKGLLTPVVRSVDTASIGAVAGQVAALRERIDAGDLPQSDLEGGSICVTNLGMFGVEEFTAIINPPQVAILAVGAAAPAPVVVDGELAIATVMKVTLSVDHRPVDGVVAARWLKEFVDLVEHPFGLLL